MRHLPRHLFVLFCAYGLMACQNRPSETFSEASSSQSFSGLSVSELWNQSPKRINKFFEPSSSLEARNPSDVVISYNPKMFQPFFPQEKVDSLQVSFKDSKAVRVSLTLKGPLTDIGYGSIPGDEDTAIALTTQFYQALFPKDEPDFRLLRATHPGESLQVYDYCLNDQIATSFISGQLYELDLSFEPSCNQKPES